MVSTDVPRNATQRAGKIIRVAGRIVNANLGIYTVPVGKNSRVTDMTGLLNAVGADATYAIAIKTGAVFTPITTFKPINEEMSASAITLVAGDILTNVGDAGSTNGTFDLSATVEEFSS